MEMADYWLTEKQLIHKLFKVLVPRYENYSIAFTKMYKAPTPYNVKGSAPYKKAILELRGNPYPSLLPDTFNNRNLIHNVLLDQAKKEYRAKKYADIAAKIEAEEIKLTKGENALKEETEIVKNVDTDVKNVNIDPKNVDTSNKQNREGQKDST